MATRPVADTDSRERLLAGRAGPGPSAGCASLTVRAVATQAQANLGSFVYHFGTRDAFVAELIERLYAPLMAGLELECSAGARPGGQPAPHAAGFRGLGRRAA
jgi:hypothetical protein